jgi:alpha-ribazole phosphatase
MPRKLILIRHGQTAWNDKFRLNGHTDIELDEEGKKQACALQKRFAETEIAAIYASDLCRAYETACIIAQPHGLKVKPDSSLREINFGAWEGLVFADIKRDYPAEAKIFWEAPQELRIPQGETFVEMQYRAFAVVQKILTVEPVGNIVIVTHAIVIETLLCTFGHEPINEIWKYKQKNTAVNILRPEWSASASEFVCVPEILNDVSHLELQ